MTKNTNLKRQIRERMAVTGENYLTAFKNVSELGQAFETPWRKLNIAVLGGYRTGLHVIGGRPGSGKTALSLQLAGHHNSGRVLYFTADLTVDEIKARADQFNPNPLSDSVQFISSYNWTSRELQEETRRWAQQVDLPLKAVILGEPSLKTSEVDSYEAGLFASELHSLAHELNIPIIVLAPLHRKQSDEKPSLVDLVETITTASADTVLLLQRNVEGNSSDVHVSKNRYGHSEFTFQLEWNSVENILPEVALLQGGKSATVLETPITSWNEALLGGFTAGVNVVSADGDGMLSVIQRLGVEIQGLKEPVGDAAFGVMVTSVTDFSTVHKLHAQALEKDIPILCFVPNEISHEYVSTPAFTSTSELFRPPAGSGVAKNSLSVLKVSKGWKKTEFPITL